MLSNLGLQTTPVPKVSGRHPPQIELQFPLLGWTANPSFIRSILRRDLAGSLEGAVVDCLENLNVELFRLGRIERHAECHEGIGKTLHTNPDGSVTEVGTTSFGDGIVVYVNNAIQVIRNRLGHSMELVEVILAVGDESGESQRSKITDSGLVW